MAYFHDDGVFDVPLETIWKYMNDQHGAHGHSMIASQKVVEQKGNQVKMEIQVRDPKGGTERQVWLLTMDPPFDWEMEFIEGSWKGTKHTHTYVPMGNKTKVVVAGDFRIAGLSEADTVKAARDFFAKVFEEDSANLRKFK